MVHEDTGQLVADGALHQGRGDGGIHAAGQPADHAGVADLRADALHLLFHDVAGGPVGLQPGTAEQEVLQHLLAVRGVLHFRVPLHAVEFLFLVREGRYRGAGRAGQHVEAFGRLLHRVAVAHPGVLRGRDAGQDRPPLPHQGGVGGAVLAQAGLRHRAAQGVGHGLEAVADAEHRDAGLEQVGADPGSALGVHAGRTAGEDDGGRVLGHQLFGGEGVRNDFGVHVGFAHAAGNQLRVLGPVVNNEDRPVVRSGGGRSSHPYRIVAVPGATHFEVGLANVS